MKHRIGPRRTTRKLRRALAAESPTHEAVNRLQGQRIAKWAADDLLRMTEQLARMAEVRTLRCDEQAQARTPSQGAVMAAAAIWNEHTAIEEHRDAYLIPRESLTSRLCLRLFKPVMEFRDETWRVLDQASRDKLAALAHDIRRAHPDNREAYAALRMAQITPTLTYVSGSDPRQTWKSDTTLLNTRKGYDTLEYIAFKRAARRAERKLKIEKETTDLPTWDADGNPT